MGILTVLLVLLCISTGCFAIGAVSGSKLGSCYNSSVTLKTALFFVVSNLIALSVSFFLLGKLLQETMAPVAYWIIFSFLFLIGVRLLLESIEKSPSLNYTDIVQSGYLIRVAVQASVDSFMFGFILSLSFGTASKVFLLVLFFSAIFNFFATSLGLSHGHSYTKSVIGKRLELVAGIVMVVASIVSLLSANG
jgi:putative Mn2+ efflux pump MntP